MAYSQTIAEVIYNYLVEDDWHFTFDEKQGKFNFVLSSDNSNLKKIVNVIRVKEDHYTISAYCPIGIAKDDKEKMLSMAEFICRINNIQLYGNFNLDMNDGELSFKQFVDCEGIVPSKEMIRNSIYIPNSMYSRYSIGICEIVFGNVSAQEAVDKCTGALLKELLDQDLEFDDEEGEEED